MIVENNTVDLEISSRGCAIATTTRDQLTLLRGGADASGTTGERRTAALRLALVVLEDEERVGARLKGGAHEFLIRGCVAPGRHSILGHNILGVKVANGLVALSISTRVLQERAGKAFTRGAEGTGSVVDHQDVRSKQYNKACYEETETHDSSLLKDFFRSLRV